MKEILLSLAIFFSGYICGFTYRDNSPEITKTDRIAVYIVMVVISILFVIIGLSIK
jgi:hypothetical protein